MLQLVSYRRRLRLELLYTNIHILQRISTKFHLMQDLFSEHFAAL